MNITSVPLDELLSDWDDTVKDVALCFLALGEGVVTYGQNESVHHRLVTNLKIGIQINTELLRRAGEEPK